MAGPYLRFRKVGLRLSLQAEKGHSTIAPNIRSDLGMINMEISQFLLDRLSQQYSPDDVDRICGGYEVQRRTSLRINPLRAADVDVRAELAKNSIAFEDVSWYPDALLLDADMEQAVQALPAYESGMIYLQSLSSMIPPLLLGAKEGENILDMAAAPGGKTTEIAALTDGKAMITACERDAGRAKRLQYNLSRQGAGRVTVMTRDARTLDDFFRFDRILLDAPCSGSGTVSARSKGVFSDKNLQRTTKLQREMLEKAIRLVSAGHEIVYSTCSILREENEAILAPFIRSGKVSIVPIDEARFAGIPRLPVSVPGTLCICPDDSYEGFFAAHLIRQ